MTNIVLTGVNTVIILIHLIYIFKYWPKIFSYEDQMILGWLDLGWLVQLSLIKFKIGMALKEWCMPGFMEHNIPIHSAIIN